MYQYKLPSTISRLQKAFGISIGREYVADLVKENEDTEVFLDNLLYKNGSLLVKYHMDILLEIIKDKLLEEVSNSFPDFYSDGRVEKDEYNFVNFYFEISYNKLYEFCIECNLNVSTTKEVFIDVHYITDYSDFIDVLNAVRDYLQI